MDAVPVLRVAFAFIIMLAASRSDWKSRTASDTYWFVLGIFGMILLAAQIYLDGVSPLYILFLVPVGILFLDTLWDRKGMFEEGLNPVPIVLYIIAFVALAALVALYWQSAYLWQLMSILFIFALIILFYQFNIIKGGADAKALLALSIVFPVYPVFDFLPLIPIPVDVAQYLFPFSFLILFDAALITIVVPIGLFIYNISKGDTRLPVMFFGYRMSVSEARKKFVWPLEYIVEGKRKLTLFPKTMDSYDEVYNELEKSGVEDLWVTPKIPFLIPLTISVLFSTIVGNLIFLFVR